MVLLKVSVVIYVNLPTWHTTLTFSNIDTVKSRTDYCKLLILIIEFILSSHPCPTHHDRYDYRQQEAKCHCDDVTRVDKSVVEQEWQWMTSQGWTKVSSSSKGSVVEQQGFSWSLCEREKKSKISDLIRDSEVGVDKKDVSRWRNKVKYNTL